MLVAKEKAKTNIGEYLIYMFQIEDLLRACNFEPEKIEFTLVSNYQVDETLKNEIRNWYLGLAELMDEEKLHKTGHLSFIQNKITELFDFHLFLLQSKKNQDYKIIYQQSENTLNDFSGKQNITTNNIVELAVNAIYGFYLLKLKKAEISDNTLKAVHQLSILLKALSEKFKSYEQGELKVYDD